MKNQLLLITLLVSNSFLFGQNVEDNLQLFVNDETHPCLSEEDYKSIELEIDKNRKALGLNNLQKRQGTITSLSFPLRPTTALTDCDYYYISAFVDLDPTSGLQDWNCGTRTYNGHRGIDYAIWPFSWDKMDNNLVEVIAAAPGTIIAKVDGNPDRVCDGVGGGSNSNNYIIIEHTDGSTALYVHMKTGAMTIKTVGQTVNTGEYLGIVGSAGQSTGVHLHFEIRSDGTFANYIDPFYGTCNTGIGSSWWAAQQPYSEPKILKLSLHNSLPYMAVCPNTVDTTYEQDVFITSPGLQTVFQACTKHIATNDVWNFRILNPDNTVFDSWNYTSLSSSSRITLRWGRNLPTMPGVYTFEGTFNSITCTKNFTIQSITGIEAEIDYSTEVSLFPNPTNGAFFINIPEHLLFPKSNTIKIFDALGKLTFEEKIVKGQTRINVNLNNGLYYYFICDNESKYVIGKLQIIK